MSHDKILKVENEKEVLKSLPCKAKLHEFIKKLFHIKKRSKKELLNHFPNSDINNNSDFSLDSSKRVSSYFVSHTFSTSTISDVTGESWNKDQETVTALSTANFELVDEKDNHGFDFLQIPIEVRGKIYSLLAAKDILSLRLLCKTIKSDVDTSLGVTLRLHDGRLDYEKPLQALGIQRLIIEQFQQENEKIYKTFFPLPHLLKTLILSGPISQRNLEFLLQLSYNLENLRITYDFSEERLVTFTFKKIMIFDSLKRFEISSSSFPTADSSDLLCSNIRNVMNYIHCPNLSYFVFSIIDCFPRSINELHALAKVFILQNRRSLKHASIHIFEIGPRPTLTRILNNSLDDGVQDVMVGEWSPFGPAENYHFKLESIHMTVNSNMGNIEHWRTFINIQTNLTTLKLNISGQLWNRLMPVFNNCKSTLRHVSVTGVTSSFSGTNRIPLDISLLQNMELLEHLEIHHQDIGVGALSSASVIRTSTLPTTLKSVKLRYLQLKPYQTLFFFMKLPNIRELTLDFWVDSESTLASFITVLTFLIKFDQTPVQSYETTEFRRQMENQEDALVRMTNVLQNHAQVTQAHSELYSTLAIKRFKNKIQNWK